MGEKGLWIVFLVLLLLGCRMTAPEEQGRPGTIVLTPTPAEEVLPPVDDGSIPHVPPLPGQDTFERVDVQGTGLSIEMPAGWLRLDPE